MPLATLLLYLESTFHAMVAVHSAALNALDAVTSPVEQVMVVGVLAHTCAALRTYATGRGVPFHPALFQPRIAELLGRGPTLLGPLPASLWAEFGARNPSRTLLLHDALDVELGVAKGAEADRRKRLAAFSDLVTRQCGPDSQVTVPTCATCGGHFHDADALQAHWKAEPDHRTQAQVFPKLTPGILLEVVQRLTRDFALEQRAALCDMLEGHHVCLIGPGGSGKSRVLQAYMALSRLLHPAREMLAVTAPYWMAANNLGRGAVTWHRLVGLGVQGASVSVEDAARVTGDPIELVRIDQ